MEFLTTEVHLPNETGLDRTTVARDVLAYVAKDGIELSEMLEQDEALLAGPNVQPQAEDGAVAASKHIYKGALGGLSATGYAQPLVAGDKSLGLAYEEIDNSAGADAAKVVRLYTVSDFQHALGSSTVADIGKPAFASSDNILTLTSTGNTFVGWVKDVPTAGTIILRPHTDAPAAATIADPTGGATVDAEAGRLSMQSWLSWKKPAWSRRRSTARKDACDHTNGVRKSWPSSTRASTSRASSPNSSSISTPPRSSSMT